MKPLGRQRGSIFVMFAVVLVTVIALMGLALDLAHAYNRKAELQAIADAAALAAARELDGTQAGVDAALAAASQFTSSNYQASVASFSWSPDALRFGEDPDAPEGDWVPAGGVNSSNLARIKYVRLDSAGLAGQPGTVRALLMSVLVPNAAFELRAVAVAGQASSHVTPLGVCAIDHTRYTQRVHNAGVNNELVEHGFRRGVGYNLLNLNPNGTSPVSYLVNPVDRPPKASVAGHMATSFVAPYVCAGRMGIPANGTVHVAQPFPAALVTAFNSRFNQYGSGLCKVQGAPPDTNILSYNGTQASGWWMNGVPSAPSAKAAIENGKLLTVADIAIPSPLTNKVDLGTLWSYARPVAYNPSAPGYAGAPFQKSDWPYLYPSSPATASTYPNAQLPYIWNVAPYRVVSPVTGLRFRRVLYVPLLACPVAGSEATVLAIGKFLMTVPATTTPLAVHAEFGGLAGEGELTQSVVLFK